MLRRGPQIGKHYPKVNLGFCKTPRKLTKAKSAHKMEKINCWKNVQNYILKQMKVKMINVKGMNTHKYNRNIYNTGCS